MANHSYSFPVDSFGNMQQNMSQHLQPQQNVAGVPDAYAHAWSDVSEQFRISNGAVGGPQAPQGAHQMSQQHQSMPQNMSLLGNQALTAQLQRQAPRMPHTGMNTQNQYQQQQQPQQHQLQFNQNNLIGNMGINHNNSAAAAAAQLMQGRQNPPIFPPSSNINPAVALQLQKINNGIAQGQAQVQRPSGSSQGNVLQQSSANYAQFEQRMSNIQEQGKIAVQTGNTIQIRQARDAAAELQKKSNEERERWAGIFQQVRANGVNDNTAKQVEIWFVRYQKLYERADHIVKSLETAVQSIQQQQQQAQQHQVQQQQQAQQQQQQQNAASMMSGNFSNDGRVSALGMSTQQQWTGLQREAANQATMHTQSSFAAQAQQNRSGLNAMNYGTNFPNSTTQQQPAPDFNAMQNNRPGMSQMGGAQPEPNPAIRENFLKVLQTQHVDPRVFIAGRPIDLWDLWHTVKRFDATTGHPPNHPSKFQIIGAQLGVPTDSQGQMPWAYQKELQEHYARVSIALLHARNPQARQTPLPQTNLGASQASHNAAILQAALKAAPHIDFSGITQDMITNLPPQRLEARIKAYISERQPVNKSQVAGNTPHMPPRTPVPGPATMNPRIQTPVGSGPTNNGQMSRPNMAPPINMDEIIRLHDHCQQMWRQTYDTLPLPTFPMPNNNNVQTWKERYSQAVHEMRPIIMAMGLYLHLRREQKDMIEIIQKSVLLMKQKQLMGSHVLLTIPGLEDTIKFFRTRMLDLQERTERFRVLGNLPPALHAFINPSDIDSMTLGGLLPTPPPAPTPSHPQTPAAAAGRMTPAPPVAGPTPPHIAGPSAGLAATRHRRNGISDAPGANMASPATFGTSPAAGLPTAASPAPSPPKAGKVTRQRGNQKRKASKSANTPTPAAEPASTPTPATTAATPAPATLKRQFDETEAQAPSQPGSQPSAKRVKTEPSPPAMPPKPVTPPPQISAPIKREEIRTAEDAKELLTESFKKSEEQAVISQSQGQGSQDLDLGAWLSQIVAGSADPGPSTLLTDLGSLIPMANEPDSQVEGADLFFDYTAYFDTDAMTVPELDQRPTLSPESHNDATTTPPSQTNAPARPGPKATEQNAAGTGAPLATAVKVEEVQIGTMNTSDYMMNFFGEFSYDGTVEQLDEPWAIA